MRVILECVGRQWWWILWWVAIDESGRDAADRVTMDIVHSNVAIDDDALARM